MTDEINQREGTATMKLTTITIVSVDGVMQGLGAPDEDRRGGFERGGWVGPLFDDEAATFLNQVYQRADAFLFGRRQACSLSTTSPVSTGSTCAPPTRSSRPSQPSGYGSGSPRDPARGPPGSRWRSNSSSRHSTAGVPSIPPTSSRWSEPARSSRTASSSNDPTNQQAVTLTPHDTLIHRP
jgi:hypothetical protein